MALAAIALHELTFDAAWLERARELSESMVRWFWDENAGTFYDTAADHETLITRPREVTDNAVPSGTSLAVELLVRIAELFHDTDARRRAIYVVEALAPAVARYPAAFGHLLGAADLLVNGAAELAIVGEPGSADLQELERVVATRYLPSLVVAGGKPAASTAVALLEGRVTRDGRATAYVCRNYACNEPVTEGEELARQLDELRGRG